MRAKSSAMLTPAPTVSAMVLSCHWLLDVVGWEDDPRPEKGGNSPAGSGEAKSASGGFGFFEFLGLGGSTRSGDRVPSTLKFFSLFPSRNNRGLGK